MSEWHSATGTTNQRGSIMATINNKLTAQEIAEKYDPSGALAGKSLAEAVNALREQARVFGDDPAIIDADRVDEYLSSFPGALVTVTVTYDRTRGVLVAQCDEDDSLNTTVPWDDVITAASDSDMIAVAATADSDVSIIGVDHDRETVMVTVRR